MKIMKTPIIRPFFLCLLACKHVHAFVSSATSLSSSFINLPISQLKVSNNQRQRQLNLLLRATSDSTSIQNDNDDDDDDYDLAVIGAGPVGVRAAIVASSAPYHKKVCLIDAPTCSGVLLDNQQNNNQDLSIGGPTGLFSKALRDTSKRMNVSTLRGMQLREESIWNEILSTCLDFARTNADDVRRQLDSANVKYMEGLGSFTGNGIELSIATPSCFSSSSKKRLLHPKKILIATGSKPFRPDSIPFDGKRIFDSDSINALTYLPKSIAITGSGIIAIEYAKIFRNLGADVTLIIRDKIPRKALMKIGLDIDIAATLVADLVRSGIKFERNAQVKHFDIPSGPQSPIRIQLEGKNGEARTGGNAEIICDAYLAAVGRKPKTMELKLDSIGVIQDKYGGIIVNGDLETNIKNVHAAGDVLGRPFLASTGVAQGVAAVEAMFGSVKEVIDSEMCDPDLSDCPMDDDLSRSGGAFDPKSLVSNPFAFPVGVWSSPEAAYYGLSKQQAEDFGIDAGEGMALYAECLRGQVFSPNGILKLVFEKPKGRILGVHICGDDACELIHYGMELVRAKRTVEDVVNNLYSAVTFHEMYRIAAMAAMDEAGARKRRAAAGNALARRNRQKFANANK